MNPTTGTFISMDAYSGTTDNPVSQHKYLYANANPVMYEDPSGYRSMMECLMSMSMSQILIGCSMIGSVFGYADAVLSGENVLVGILKGALAGFTIGWGLYAIAQQAVMQLIVSGILNIVQAYMYVIEAIEALEGGNSIVANLRMMIAALSGAVGAYAVGEGIAGIVNFIQHGGNTASISEMAYWVNEAATTDGRTFFSRYDIPTNIQGYTQSSLRLGQLVHAEYRAEMVDYISRFKEYILPSGRRVDFIDFANRIVYELKPYNLNQIRRGTIQLQNYIIELENEFGGEWIGILDLY